MDTVSALSRRRLLRRGVALGALGAAGLAGYAWRIEPIWWHAIHRALPVAHLPAALEGKTLVQVSDLHAGPRVDEGYLGGVMEAVGRFEPDLVVVTGDLVHYTRPRDLEAGVRVLSRLAPPPLGTIAILGNHDYGRSWSDGGVANDLVAALDGLGIRVLRNEQHDVSGLQIVGMDDLWAGRFAPEKALDGLDPQRASLVLCHNPDAVDQPGWGDHRGWILAGHTHGGQVKPPFLPPPLLPVENPRYTRGEVDAGGGRRLYINVGLGYLRRIRFNVRPEVTVFTLRRARLRGEGAGTPRG